MSEFIDNVEQSPRMRALLEFAHRVHEGEAAEEIAEEYEKEIEAVHPYDVLVIEDSLLQDGVSIPEVKANIEPILAAFRPALTSHSWERPERGHPIDTFLREDRAIESKLEALDRTLEALDTGSGPSEEKLADLRTQIEALEDISRHFVRKENELFPHLEDHWKHDGLLGVMWSTHDDLRSIRSTLEQLLSESMPNLQTVSKLLTRYRELLSGLCFKEEYVLYPVALETLSEAEWTQIQRESREIGYFEIDPTFALIDDGGADDSGGPASDSVKGSKNPSSQSTGTVTLGLDTGTLELDQLQLLLDTIPLDVTFVDENDRVRFFNNPEERIFPRSGSIIGRTVQNCHPPESVDTVEEILEAFKAGEEDVARFWIQNDEAFVVIDYHALRDDSGTYRGTLEVTREVSDVRALEGEQRLIEWGE